MNKEKNSDLKNMFIGLGVLLFYFISAVLPQELITLFGINYNKLNTVIKQIYLSSCQIIITLIIIYIYRKDFIPSIKKFFKNIKSYIDKYFKYWFIMLFLMVISNMIVSNFTSVEVAQNQQSIIDSLKQEPIYIFVVTILVAPVLEELVFRLSFRKIFAKTNWLFILFSGLFFGSMHVLGGIDALTDLLFIIPYSIPGFIFSYLLCKSENICVPIGIHFIHNATMVLIQLLI